MVEITARCHPALLGLVPPPVLAGAALPGWLRAMPGEVAADSLGGAPVRTLKHCPPLIDALGLGVLMPLACDLHVAGGEIAWDWQPPVISDALITRAPVGVHVPEQAPGLAAPDRLFLKFVNFWALAVPPGWRILFTHPLNRPDLPFTTLSGVVDCDAFADGYVHFPAIWHDPDWTGTLPAGTPVAQAIPIPRDPAALATGAMDPAQISANRAVQEALQADRGVYRKRFRLRD